MKLVLLDEIQDAATGAVKPIAINPACVDYIRAASPHTEVWITNRTRPILVDYSFAETVRLVADEVTL
jgi:hypothetical protein